MPVDVERWKRNTILIFGILCTIIFGFFILLLVIGVLANLLGW